MLVTLNSEYANKPVLSRDREGEDLNFAQNTSREVCSFANQEASWSFKMNDLLGMDYLINQYLSGCDFKRKKVCNITKLACKTMFAEKPKGSGISTQVFGHFSFLCLQDGKHLHEFCY